MEEPSVKYILLRDRVGNTVEKSFFSLGLKTKSTPMQVLRGELLEGVPEAEQPIESTRVAVISIEHKSLRLECPTEDMTRISEEEVNLLLAITTLEGRYQTFSNRKRLAFGGQLLPGSAVFVEEKRTLQLLPGVVRYKGELPPSFGTWFGVELIKNPGSGTCDGTFRNKRYFSCQPDSGVFVGLDRLTPLKDFKPRPIMAKFTSVQNISIPHVQTLEYDDRLDALTEQVANLEENLREKDEQLVNSEGQVRELTQQLANVQAQIQDKNEETANLRAQSAALQRQLEVKDQELNEVQQTLFTAQRALNESQQSPDWVISRDQIQLTNKTLGEGGWGVVVEGKYCGCAVAVKQIHQLILSPHNLRMFEREMDIASRCRHPCLLQFIGATNDKGSPLFVTELMETSLRALLGQRSLSDSEISVISLDVARALSYLHQKQPSPIIHRDVSSANVLLWRQGDLWRAKVSDYGTANFRQHTMTVAPGNVIYSAPEALTKKQTVKVDVYSFGVLLCEMCIRELPDPERRDEQVARVINRVLRALIRGCLQIELEKRPSMEDVISEIEQPI